MTVQNVSGDAKSGFGDELADTVTEQPAETGDADSPTGDDNPGGDQPADPESEGDNPDH